MLHGSRTSCRASARGVPLRVPTLPVAGAGGGAGQRVGLVDTDPGPGAVPGDHRLIPGEPVGPPSRSDQLIFDPGGIGPDEHPVGTGLDRSPVEVLEGRRDSSGLGRLGRRRRGRRADRPGIPRIDVRDAVRTPADEHRCRATPPARVRSRRRRRARPPAISLSTLGPGASCVSASWSSVARSSSPRFMTRPPPLRHPLPRRPAERGHGRRRLGLHRAGRAPEHVGDLGLAQVLVVAQHDHRALSLGQRADQRPQQRTVEHRQLRGVAPRLGQLVQTAAHGSRPVDGPRSGCWPASAARTPRRTPSGRCAPSSRTPSREWSAAGPPRRWATPSAGTPAGRASPSEHRRTPRSPCRWSSVTPSRRLTPVTR